MRKIRVYFFLFSRSAHEHVSRLFSFIQLPLCLSFSFFSRLDGNLSKSIVSLPRRKKKKTTILTVFAKLRGFVHLIRSAGILNVVDEFGHEITSLLDHHAHRCLALLPRHLHLDSIHASRQPRAQTSQRVLLWRAVEQRLVTLLLGFADRFTPCVEDRNPKEKQDGHCYPHVRGRRKGECMKTHWFENSTDPRNDHSSSTTSPSFTLLQFDLVEPSTRPSAFYILGPCVTGTKWLWKARGRTYIRL